MDIMNTTTFRLLLDEPIDRDMNSSEQAWLMNVTVLCPAEGGRVVHKARELYHQFINDTIFFDDDSLCILPPLRLASINSDEARLNNQISIFPNPTESILHLNYNFVSEGSHNYKIFDITGRLQMQRDISSIKGIETINLSSLQQGSYFIIVYNGNRQIFTEKIHLIR